MSAGERREQLLDATKALVAEAGFHAVSIEAVARRAGITRPIVYRHFDDLTTLLEALVERETVRALGQLREFVPRELGGDPREGLMAALGGYLRAVESDPVTWRLMLVPPEGRARAARRPDRRRPRRGDQPARGDDRLAGSRADGARAVLGRRRGRAAAAVRPAALPTRADPRSRALAVLLGCSTIGFRRAIIDLCPN